MLTLLKTLSFILGRLPLSAAASLGGLAYLFLRKRRDIALENLERAFGDSLTRAERERIAKKVFRNLSTMFFEFMRIPRLSPGNIKNTVEFIGLENLDRALARGKGVILLTAHFGNWELLGAGLGCMGYQLVVVARKQDSPLFEEFVSWVRTRSGNRAVDKSRAMRKLVRDLAGNSVVAILVDQNVTRSEGFFVDFFGVPACTNKGPAHLARFTGAAVVPAFIMRKGRGHRIEVLEEIEVMKTGDKDRDAVENTARFTRVVEGMIRRHPEEWFWMHRRWKTRPEAGQGFDTRNR